MNTAVPLYGKVIWKDATSYTGRATLKKITKALPLVASVGRLFLSTDGTLVVFHEYNEQLGIFQRDVEATFIPLGWIQEITPLVIPDEHVTFAGLPKNPGADTTSAKPAAKPTSGGGGPN